MSEESMVTRVAKALYVASDYGADFSNGTDVLGFAEELARAAIAAMMEPTYQIVRAMSESRAVDAEGPFAPMLDLLDFSGENKTHTVLRAAWSAGIQAALEDGK